MNGTKFRDMPKSAQVVVALFAAIGIFELLLALEQRPSTYGGLFFLMLALAMISARAKVRLPGGSTLSVLTSVVLGTLMLLGWPGAVVVSMVGVVAQSSFPWKRRVPYRIFFNMGMVGLTVVLARAGYHLIAPESSPSLGDQVAGILLASFIYYICNSIFVSLILSLSSGKPMSALWRENFLYTAPTFLLAGLIAFAAVRVALVVPVRIDRRDRSDAGTLGVCGARLS